MNSLQNWQKQILKKNYKFGDELVSNENIQNTLSLEFHKKMPKGAALREFQYKHLHLSYWETKYYKDIIRRFLKDVSPETSIVGDFGCGDGRFTEFLLDLGFKKIVATDIDQKPLQSLYLHLEKRGDLDKVLLINTAVEDLPIKKGAIDIALAIGVFYYLNEQFEQGLKEVSRVLKNKGILINSEPDLDGALFKSLIFEDVDDLLENFYGKRFKEERGETPFKFRLFRESEIKKELFNAGFKVIGKKGISLFSSILRIMMLREHLNKEAVIKHEGKIREIMDYLNFAGKLNKHIIWKSIKMI